MLYLAMHSAALPQRSLKCVAYVTATEPAPAVIVKLLTYGVGQGPYFQLVVLATKDVLDQSTWPWNRSLSFSRLVTSEGQMAAG